MKILSDFKSNSRQNLIHINNQFLFQSVFLVGSLGPTICYENTDTETVVNFLSWSKQIQAVTTVPVLKQSSGKYYIARRFRFYSRWSYCVHSIAIENLFAFYITGEIIKQDERMQSKK